MRRVRSAAVAVATIAMLGGCAGDPVTTGGAAARSASASASPVHPCSPSHSLPERSGEIRRRTTIEKGDGSPTLTIAAGQPLCIDGVGAAEVPVYWTPFRYEQSDNGLFFFTGVPTVSGKSKLAGIYDGFHDLELTFPKFKDKCTGALIGLEEEPDPQTVATLSSDAGYYVLPDSALGNSLLLAVYSRGSENCIEITVERER